MGQRGRQVWARCSQSCHPCRPAAQTIGVSSNFKLWTTWGCSDKRACTQSPPLDLAQIHLAHAGRITPLGVLIITQLTRTLQHAAVRDGVADLALAGARGGGALGLWRFKGRGHKVWNQHWRDPWLAAHRKKAENRGKHVKDLDLSH